MKRLLSVIVSVAVSGGFAAQTTLEFELKLTTYNKKGDAVDLKVSSVNRKLKKAGQPGLPSKIVLRAGDQAYYHKLVGMIAEAEKLYPKRIDSPVQGGDFTEYPVICYRGQAADVLLIIKALTGEPGNPEKPKSFFADYQGIDAVRYGRHKEVFTKEIEDKKVRDEFFTDSSDVIEAFEDYDTKSDTVLVISNIGSQGDGQLYATDIEKCE